MRGESRSALDHLGHSFLGGRGADPVGDREHARVRVGDGDAEAGPLEQLDVVLPVAEGDRPLGREAQVLGQEAETGALRHLGARELEEEGQRLGDEEAAVEAGLHPVLQPVEGVGVVDGDELRRRRREPGGEVADLVQREVLEAGVALGLRRHLGDVELVVDVAVDVEALRADGGDRLARELERDRLVAQELAGARVGDDGALVADDRVVDAGLLQVRPHRAEHAAGDDDHADPGGAGAGDRRLRPRPERAVLPDQRPVEVAGEDVGLAGKSGREDQPRAETT